ncbi:ATP synthase mitochondrial F1 complex assembly factor 2-like [Ctenocephalides felis]|uniref:ATP synthase mitochondrial F1 complex assembly factor 2-like n=1 Tax=Ctenocephalides felis TaxID=7515 RepID=UPI000E6E5860|nr:ATP synthase mitochondrial F1 complex assembly factor 2-like [Ctenocephalides felis]
MSLNMINKLFKVNYNATLQIRCYATRKRFYKKTNILYSDGKYEVTLDQRKLKSPSGKPFRVQVQPLALAVATEWEAQKKNIQQGTMYLNALCSTLIDNPSNLTKPDMVNYIVNYLTTDALLFHSALDDPLYALQCKEWDPIIEWFCDRYKVNVKKARDITPPEISEESKMALSNYLYSHNIASLQGLVFAVDTVKSVILALACADKFISTEKASYLSRLEEEFQLGHWGRVEWAHDVEQLQLQARLSAATMFIHLNTFEMFVKSKRNIEDV